MVPPTSLQVHAGRSGDVFATYQEPDVVRGSSQVKRAEHRVFVVLEVSDLDAFAGLEHYRGDALLRELVRQRAAAGAGADDYNHG